MACMCSRRERSKFLWSSLVAMTIVACSFLIFSSLHFFGKNYRRGLSGQSKAEQLGTAECRPICNSESCILQANLINELIDPEAKKCDNFYSFTCGKYLEKFSKEDNISMFTELDTRFYLELKDLLENLEADPESAAGKMKTIYASCKNKYSSEALTSAFEFFEQVGISNWPELEQDFNFIEPSLPKVLGIFAGHFEFSFLQILDPENTRHNKPVYYGAITTDSPSKSKQHILHTSKTIFEKSLGYFIGEENIDEMRNTFVNSHYFKFAKGDCDSQNITDLNIFCSEENSTEWNFLCQMVDTFVDVANVSEKVSKEHIFIPCEEVYSVKHTLKALTEKPHRITANALAMIFVLNHVDVLNLPLSLIMRDELIRNPSTERLESQWTPSELLDRCIPWLIKNMPLALAHEYTKSVITESAVLEAQSIVEESKKEVVTIILHQDWLTEDEKEFVLGKLFNNTVSTELLINIILNESFINEYYKEFHPSSESFFQNVLERQRAKFNIDMVFQAEYPNLHGLEQLSLNAAVRQNTTELGLPTLRFPVFVPKQPRFLNIIHMATFIGHEIGHIIDGAFEELTGQENKSETALPDKIEEIKSCFQMQYSNFTIESLEENVDALLTAPENYADSVQIILIDKLIEKYTSRGDYLSLPSLPYNTKELLYIIVSELNCEMYSKEAEKFQHETNEHPLSRFRVLATMQNSKLFSEVHGCPKESYMNPDIKCRFLEEI